MSEVVTRFAPSPTGHLHIGGARTALFCWLFARHFGGKFYLRIEDTDVERSLQEYTDAILLSMKWLGLDWDKEPIYQTQRTDIYNGYVEKLLNSGHAYWCSCLPEDVDKMREEAKKQGLKPRYAGCCRESNVGSGTGHCVRLKSPQQGKIMYNDIVKGNIVIDASELDDMVIRRSDGMPTYNMAVVVDDYEMGVSHVIRGDDHVSNTPKQILIYEALGLDLPKFGHVPMILGADKQKLSKRHGARSVIEYEQDGLLPQALVNYLVRLGWAHGDKEIFSMQELIAYFDGTSLSTSPSCFDSEKLQWFNGQYLRALSNDDLSKLVIPFLKHKGFSDLSKEKIQNIVHLYGDRANNLVDLVNVALPILLSYNDLVYDEAMLNKVLKNDALRHIKALNEIFANLDTFETEFIEKLLNGYISENGYKFKEVGPVLRVALTANQGGPHLPELISCLGKNESLCRLDRFYKENVKNA